MGSTDSRMNISNAQDNKLVFGLTINEQITFCANKTQN